MDIFKFVENMKEFFGQELEFENADILKRHITEAEERRVKTSKVLKGEVVKDEN